MALSFAIQRPKPAAFANDSDEEDAPAVVEERISELGPKSKAQARQPSLVIPSQPNKDWKAEASRMRGLARKTQTYLPQNERARASTAQPDGQTDRIIDKTVGGLKVHEATSRSGTVTPTTELAREISATTLDSPAPSPAPAPLPLTEDELALRELLRGPDAEQEEEIETIHIAEDSFNLRAGGNVNEDDLFKQDLASRPDSATLADYARVPVEQFGAALLRGMSASSTSRPVKTEAYIPKARPSLLGIGAKPLEMPTDGKATKKELSAREKAIKRREEMHFVPLVKRKVVSAIEGPATSSLLMAPPQSTASTPTRRRRSPSPSSDSYSKRHRRERSYSPERRRRRDYSDDERGPKRSGRERSRSPQRRRRERSRSRSRDREDGKRRGSKDVASR